MYLKITKVMIDYILEFKLGLFLITNPLFDKLVSIECPWNARKYIKKCNLNDKIN